MIEISCNNIRLGKYDSDIIEKINKIITSSFSNIELEKNTIRVFFLEDEEYYSTLGYDKPYRNLVVSDGYYHKDYQEIFIRLNAKSIIRTYIHEVGHFIDYNLVTEVIEYKAGSAFARKIYADITYEQKVLEQIKKMPAYTLIHAAAGPNYVFRADEIFARIFEAYIWEKLERKHFTPDLYIKTPLLFLRLNNWLANKKDSFLYKRLQSLHLYLLKKTLNKRSCYDPFKRNIFSTYIDEYIKYS